MEAEKIWIGDAADQLSVSQSTVRAWCDRMEFHSKDSKGRRIISSEQFRALQAVQALLDDGHTFNTVQRRLRDPAEDSQRDRSAHADDSQSVHSDPAALIGAVVTAIAQQTDLAEKYARAAHEIGKLEERTLSLTDQLQEARSALAEAQQQIKLLEAPKPKEPWWRRSWF
jgi:DNA-binding transcriptional MerR regulator